MLRRLLATATLLPLAAASALAQFGNLKVPNLEYNPVLLINPSVQKELKLSPTVASKIQNGFMQQAMQLLPVVSGNGNGGGKALTPQQRQQAVFNGVSRMQTTLVAMLNPAQKGRLRQLSLQSIGPSAVLQPKVAANLGLTSVQRSKLSSSFVTANQKIANSFSKSSTPQQWQGRMGEMSKLQAAAKAQSEKALQATLTPAQKAKWRAMLGKPFAMSGFMGIGNGMSNFGG